MNKLRLFAIALGMWALGAVGAQAQLENYFAPASAKVMTPDQDGFIRRWMLLEPFQKQNRSNTVFVDSYIRDAFKQNAPELSAFPTDGQKAKIGDQELTWHAMDSKLFNVKLFRFASENKWTYYGIIFWATTIINCDEDIKNVRMAVGSNSASMWWLNGEEAVILSGDRRMVKDDCTSGRLTLKKGQNIIKGAVINGPGMSDFCLRFLNEDGTPVKNVTVSVK